MKFPKLFLVAGLVATAFVFLAAGALAAPVRMLLLSGANNHDWRATTPVLKNILENCGRVVVDVETNVPAMKPEVFKKHDVILSNFNTFSLNDHGLVSVK